MNFSLSNLITLITFLLFLPLPPARRRALPLPPLRCLLPAPPAFRALWRQERRLSPLRRERCGAAGSRTARKWKEIPAGAAGWTPDTSAGRAGGSGGRAERGESPAAGAPLGGRRARPSASPAPRHPLGGVGGWGVCGEPSRAGPPPSLLFPPRGGRPADPRRPGPAPCGAPPPRPRPAPAPPPLRLGLGRGAAPGRRGSRAEPRRAGRDSLLALASPSPARLLFFGRFSKKKKKSGSGF